VLAGSVLLERIVRGAGPSAEEAEMHAMFTEAVLTQRRIRHECFVIQMTAAVKQKLLHLEDDFH